MSAFRSRSSQDSEAGAGDRRFPRVPLLQVRVDAIRLDETVEQLIAWSRDSRCRTVSMVTGHGLQDAQRSREVREALGNADLAAPDGMSVVWTLQLAGYPRAGQVYGPDLLIATCAASENAGRSHYFLGGSPGANEQLRESLLARFPTLRIAGGSSPQLDSRGGPEAAVRREAEVIGSSGADLVWVGLGTPKQDVFMARVKPHLGRGVLIGVGAAFDFLSGQKKQAPPVMRRLGLEWLFRWMTEPARLSRRYVRYPKLVVDLVREVVRLRRRPAC